MNLLCQDLKSSDSSKGTIAICLKKGPKGLARYRTSHFIWFGEEGEYRYWTHWYEETVNEFEALKDLTGNQSGGLSVQMGDSFRFRVKGLEDERYNLIRMSTGARTPIQCWDPLTKTFFTGGFGGFTGLLQLDLEASLRAINSPLIAPRPVFLLFGLIKLEEDRQEITRGDTHNRAARPWVALYCDSSFKVPGQRILIESHGPRFTELADVWEKVEFWKDSVSDYPYELLAIRRAILEDIRKGSSPPTTLTIRQDPAPDLKAPKQLVIKVALDNNTQRKGNTRSVEIDIMDLPCRLSEDSNLQGFQGCNWIIH
jgi:hypothetical protein